MLRFAFLLTSILLLTACATDPKFDQSIYQTTPIPSVAIETFDESRDKKILWGSVLINLAQNEKNAQLEILAYPLDSTQKPDTSQPPLGRYLAIKDGYLEALDYTSGRLVTTIGTISNLQTGKVGQSTQMYPVVELEQLHLWPKYQQAPETRFHIGVGVIFGD